MICLFLFFFFSSRRRHTRFDCDWSSDVCSSDLVQDAGRFLELAVPDDVVGRVELATELMQAVEEGLTPFTVLDNAREVIEFEKVHRAVAAAGIPEVMKHVIPVIEAHPGEAGISSEG